MRIGAGGGVTNSVTANGGTLMCLGGARVSPGKAFVQRRDPRTARRYDRARDTLDRKAAYIFAVHLVGS